MKAPQLLLAALLAGAATNATAQDAKLAVGRVAPIETFAFTLG
jgi:hypothetical protein